ncbi:alcohol dehydrogenase [Exophiala viscosa]|uniref:alcohol dehydrogenase n=1 Tax=Exophiala viscosa TaxID=2486360 RepID=UPI0021960AEE|nr:alcohol dehydrogenase [Exophiala viscosa]
MYIPQYTAAGILNNQIGIEGLQFVERLPLPAIKEDEVLVKIHAASLNYSDLMIAAQDHAQGGPGLTMGKKRLVLGSDGAGVVGADSKSLLFTWDTEADLPGVDDVGACLGQTVDGTLRQYGVFHEKSLVSMPSNLTFLEAATLSCSGLTAWNALFGLEGTLPRTGGTIVVQGAGGASIAALQFSLAAGATVIATTSTEEKASKLKALGAHHVVNYRETPDWSERVKALTPNGKGADIVVDVGGASTLRQSMEAVRRDGLIAATGVFGQAPDGRVSSLLDCIFCYCTVRGFFLGSRKQFGNMNRFIETHDIKPVLDQKTFEMASVKEAFTFLQEQKHFSKIGISPY